jgi:predicted nucleic acid-binding protein
LTPHGISAKLLDAAEQGTFDLCISHEILDEAQHSLRTKVKRLSLGSHDGVRIVPPLQFLDFLSPEDALRSPQG